MEIIYREGERDGILSIFDKANSLLEKRIGYLLERSRIVLNDNLDYLIRDRIKSIPLASDDNFSTPASNIYFIQGIKEAVNSCDDWVVKRLFYFCDAYREKYYQTTESNQSEPNLNNKPQIKKKSKKNK